VFRIEAAGMMMRLCRVYRTCHVSKLAVEATSTANVTHSKAGLLLWEPQVQPGGRLRTETSK